MDSKKSYKITPSLRKQLAIPIGTLFEGSIDQNILKVIAWFKEHSISHPDIICVGDVVSHAFLTNPQLSNFLKLCIVDEHTNRGKFTIKNAVSGYNIIRLKNSAGLIQAKAIERIRETIRSGNKTILLVEGEEDLLVLPTILYSSPNTFVIYGQPPITDLERSIPAGLVILPVTNSIQTHVKNLLDQFEKV
jgi:uncharacterized protein (UPF0218 family)